MYSETTMVAKQCRLREWVNIPASMSLLSGDRKPQIRFYGNRHSGYGNH
jgi:hypothetical protein